MTDLFYNGQVLKWVGINRNYKATSGVLEYDDGDEGGKKDSILDYRYSKYQCKKDYGPIPEGLYYFVTKDSGEFAFPKGNENWKNCNLQPANEKTGIQKIPRDLSAKKKVYGKEIDCEANWANWGMNRIKILPFNKQTKNKCFPRRYGFYIHDSTKGYSHGCIETEKNFFSDLRLYIKNNKTKKLVLKVAYKHVLTHTYGFTDSASTPIDMLLP